MLAGDDVRGHTRRRARRRYNRAIRALPSPCPAAWGARRDGEEGAVVPHRGGLMPARVLVTVLLVALAFAVGVAAAPLLAPPLAGAHALVRGGAREGRAPVVDGAGAGRPISDLITGGESSHISCPPGRRPSGGDVGAVACVRGAP